MNHRERFRTALTGDGPAFAPIVWEHLPALVRQEQADWWRDATVGQRLIADAAALALADAMFVFTAAEASRRAVADGARGDDALDGLVESPEVEAGVELVRCLHDVAAYAVIAALPTPAALLRDFGGEEIEAAEDAFSDLASACLDAGADALAVAGGVGEETQAGARRATDIGALFGRPVLGLVMTDGAASGWGPDGAALGVMSEDGTWPPGAPGLVITPGDVSGRWDAPALRAAGRARP